MQITNQYDLPAPLVSAIVNDTYRDTGDISVTRLIGPPRKHQLELRHDAGIITDATDYLWTLLGQTVHEIFRRADVKGYEVEKRLTAKVGNWTLSGQPDLLTPEHVLQDWKVTSVWSFLLGDKPEWEAQLNCYAWLYGQQGVAVRGLEVVAILRDWQNSKAGEGGYPSVPFIVKPIELWQPRTQQRYIEERVTLHQFAEAAG